jgi:hypothetical protein
MNKKQRRCQDIICLLVFVSYVGAMGFMSVYGFIHGDVTKLLAPIDGNGDFCGINNNVNNSKVDFTEYPNLYIGDLAKGLVAGAADPKAIFGTGVCVKKCPKTEDGKIAVECMPGTMLCIN